MDGCVNVQGFRNVLMSKVMDSFVGYKINLEASMIFEWDLMKMLKDRNDVTDEGLGGWGDTSNKG